MADQNDSIPPVEPPPAAPAPSYEQPVPPGYVPAGYPAPGYPQYAPVPQHRSPILSLLALIAGIVSTIGLWVAVVPFAGFFLGLWFPAAAVVLGFIGRKREPQSKGLWLTAIILGLVGLVVAFASLIFWIVFAVHGGFGGTGSGYGSNGGGYSDQGGISS